jgi:catalase-peroxidase
MNDYETVTLIAGEHTFGRSHGAYPDSDLGPGPKGASIEKQGIRYTNNQNGSGMAADTTTSRLEGAYGRKLLQNGTWTMSTISFSMNGR